MPFTWNLRFMSSEFRVTTQKINLAIVKSELLREDTISRKISQKTQGERYTLNVAEATATRLAEGMFTGHL